MNTPIKTEPPKMTLREFLEGVHPGVEATVTNFVTNWTGGLVGGTGSGHVKGTEIRLYCPHDDCQREQRYEWSNYEITVAANSWSNMFLGFKCRNCGSSIKHFAIRAAVFGVGNNAGRLLKIGEIPNYGVKKMGARFAEFLGSSRELYFRGRRCESLGMGIGAFAYYRRVVDDQRIRLFDAILEVCTTFDASAETIKQLEAAKKETQFSRAVETIKAALPESLYISGHSPLSLLYAALSRGVHELTDEECLQKAHGIRLVLVELLDRVGTLLTEDKELRSAVAALMPPNRTAEDGKT